MIRIVGAQRGSSAISVIRQRYTYMHGKLIATIETVEQDTAVAGGNIRAFLFDFYGTLVLKPEGRFFDTVHRLIPGLGKQELLAFSRELVVRNTGSAESFATIVCKQVRPCRSVSDT